MKLRDLLSGISIFDFSGNEQQEIRGISYSSKKVQPGFLFAALKGEKTDGHQFIQEAVSKGAAAVLAEKPKPPHFEKSWIHTPDARQALAVCSANFYSHPSRHLKIVGITGTKGKTTVTYLLEEILKKAKLRPGVMGTISYRGPNLEMPAERTTPEAPDLQRLLSLLLAEGATHCLIEVSSHALELKRVVGIEFDAAVFTNLSGEHLDYHLSMENYYEAKKKLFFSDHKKSIAVVNTDDPWGKKLIAEIPMSSITYGLDPSAIVHAQKYNLSQQGIELEVKYPGGTMALSSPLLGKPNLYNILAAAAVALSLKFPSHAIKEGTASLQGVPGRFERIENSLGLHIFVDYAHTDDALRNLLKTAREQNPRRLLLVFGAGGDRDKAKRPRMGEVASRLADWTILTSDNPRSEDPLAIISEIEKGFKKNGEKNYQIMPNRREAIKKALSMGKKGDFILVAGKGHENYQIVGHQMIPFHDAEVIRDLLKRMEANRNG
ncbi:MAG: UDP-N-acetylmuramoyl-L-alanyl-D-glutamate--2,6-diaminopimelate ligase [Candidatus Aminicenantes bacterium]